LKIESHVSYISRLVEWYSILAILHNRKEGKKTIPCMYTCLEQGVCHTHCGLAIYIKKYLKAKEELWKLKYLITMQKYIIFKKSS